MLYFILSKNLQIHYSRFIDINHVVYIQTRYQTFL